MQRFLLLAGDNYYPNGWKDYRGKADTIEACIEILLPLKWDWYEIIDTETMTVAKTGCKLE